MRKYLLFICTCLFILQVQVAFAQRKLTGLVKGADGQALPGVTIQIQSNGQSSSTDANGRFELSVPEQAVLIYSYIGFQSRTLTVGSQSFIEVTLEKADQELEEVVVIGYGTQKKSDLTGSITSVSTKDIESRPLVNAAQALQGKAAGVQVTQPSGKPGQGLSVRVRGATSVQAGNDPLYVVDGVPTTDIRELNVNDIASMQVLKDASSAAIYGARASNGVVIITTKRGLVNSSAINFGAYYGASQVAKKIDVLNPDQYRDLMKEMGYTQGLEGTETTDWTKEIFQTGKNQNYQLSFQGGSEKSQYFVSGSYTDESGIIKPARYKRTAFRANLDNKLKDWLKLTTNFSYSNADIKDVKDNENAGRNAVVLGALGAPPTMGIFTTDAEGRQIYTMNPNKSGWDNPLAAVDGPIQGTFDHKIFGNAALDVSILKNLVFRTNIGIDYGNHKWDYFLDPYKTTEGRNPSNNGLGRSEKSNSFTYLWENTLNYNNQWGKHQVEGLLGTTYQKNQWDNSYLEGVDFPKDLKIYTINAANQIKAASTSETEWALNSYIARAMYNYDSRYLLTVNFRADGSSKLDPSHQWGYFPSVSAGWRISSESFFNSQSINDLKLRAGWGQNGNVEGLANYASYGVTSFSRRTPTSPLSGPAINNPTGMPNSDLTWETTTQSNIGIDISLFRSRLTLTADAYMKKTDDLLMNVVLPSTSGYSYVPRNAGAMQNKGLEFAVSSRNLENTALTWTTDINISLNRNKITRFDLAKLYRMESVEGRADQIIVLQEGVSLGTYFGYISEGVDPQTGMIKYKDLNNDGEITASDRTIIGSGQPDFVYGITNSFNYKNFDLSFLFQGSQGNQAFNASRMETEGMYDSKNQSTAVLNRWTTVGQVTDIPKATDGDVYNSRVSSRFVEDASFLRLKNVTLAYSLPKATAERMKLNRMQVYVTGQNLVTFTKYKGFDPEVNSRSGNGAALGIDYGAYPTARAFVFGVNLQF